MSPDPARELPESRSTTPASRSATPRSSTTPSVEATLSPRASVRAGLRDSLGVGIGVFPLGIALGMLVVQAGLPWWLAPALSIGIFAGSVELLMVSLLATATPLMTIAATVFAVNFRHVFYAFSFPLDRVRRGLPRAYSLYALIDEAYATYAPAPRAQVTSRRIVTGQLAMQGFWVAGGLVGVAIAGALPAPLEGFEFALYALFIVMTLDAVRGKRELPSVVLAGLAVTGAILCVPAAPMLPAISAFAALLVVRYALMRRRANQSAGTDAEEPA